MTLIVREGSFAALPRMLSIRCGVKYLLSWTWGNRTGSVKGGPSARNQVGLAPGRRMKGSMLSSQVTQGDYQHQQSAKCLVRWSMNGGGAAVCWRLAAGDDKAQFPPGKWILGTLFDNYTKPLWSFRSLVTIISCITLFTAPCLVETS